MSIVARRRDAPPAALGARGLDVMQARVAFRDRAFIDVLDLALRFIAVHIRLYAWITLFVLVPCLLVTTAAAAFWGWAASWFVVT